MGEVCEWCRWGKIQDITSAGSLALQASFIQLDLAIETHLSETAHTPLLFDYCHLLSLMLVLQIDVF